MWIWHICIDVHVCIDHPGVAENIAPVGGPGSHWPHPQLTTADWSHLCHTSITLYLCQSVKGTILHPAIFSRGDPFNGDITSWAPNGCDEQEGFSEFWHQIGGCWWWDSVQRFYTNADDEVIWLLPGTPSLLHVNLTQMHWWAGGLFWHQIDGCWWCDSVQRFCTNAIFIVHMTANIICCMKMLLPMTTLLRFCAGFDNFSQ